jgi:hypothetical protein
LIELTPSTSTLDHLARLCDANGIFEHAKLDRPRLEGGYCTDDAGRLLALTTQLSRAPHSLRLSQVALGFLERAHLGGGEFRLRQHEDGSWTDDAPSDDAVGRALLGLGTAAAWSPWPDVRARALALFEQAATFRSEHLRATAYAALGAVELLRAGPTHEGARRLVSDAADQLPHSKLADAWPWPEARLSYANAVLPDAGLSVAIATGSQRGVNEALGLLSWLVDQEMIEHHFSFTPVGGRGPGETKVMFDQQPIEAWAMTSACANAFVHTHDLRWAKACGVAGSWFLGNNDVGVAVFNPATGGGFDGLEGHGVNLNEGAESSLAFVATMHQLRALPPRPAEAFAEAPVRI